MKLKIFRIVATPLVALLMTSQLRANVIINWTADSLSAYDVIISGSGLASDQTFGTAAGFTGTITSPSGLWQLVSQNYCWNSGPSGGSNGFTPDQDVLQISQEGYVNFLGQLADSGSFMCETPGGYTDLFPPNAPLSDGDMLFGDFSGATHFTISSLPDLNAPSTWTWTIEYQASGPTLDVVPEPGTVCLVLFGAGILSLRKLTSSHSKNQKPH
jgi:hypothetical protein